MTRELHPRDWSPTIAAGMAMDAASAAITTRGRWSRRVGVGPLGLELGLGLALELGLEFGLG